MKIVFTLLTALLVFGSCNKEKRFSKRLQKGEIWQVQHIKVNNQEIAFKGEWYIQSDVNIYDSVPTLEWRLDTMDAFFEWQFQEKGKNFYLNYSLLCSEADGPMLDTLDYIGYDISGVYSVERKGRNRMEFISNSTLGHSGKSVEIFIERVK
jgi:hypothetical protein